MKDYLITVCPFVGVVAGGLTWLFIYNLKYGGTIPFDGPAAVMIGVSMILGALVIGLPAVIYTAHKKILTWGQAIGMWLVISVMTCAVMGAILSWYASGKYVRPRFEDAQSNTLIPRL